jgi:hypothetical protein
MVFKSISLFSNLYLSFNSSILEYVIHEKLKVGGGESVSRYYLFNQ